MTGGNVAQGSTAEGRYLAVLYVVGPDGVPTLNVNAELIAKGHAAPKAY